MANVNAEIEITEIKEVQELYQSALDLFQQIENSDFRDEEGHVLKDNDSYTTFKREILKAV